MIDHTEDAPPFFVRGDVIHALIAAAKSARRTAWEYRERNDLPGYRRAIRRAVEWRRDARRYRNEMETIK